MPEVPGPSAQVIRHSPGLTARQKELIRTSVLTVAWLAAALAVILISLAVLHSPVATVSAVVAGVAARWLGQQWNLKQLRESGKAAELAGFELRGEEIHCVFDEARMLRYTSAWKWRIAAASASAGVCLVLQHLPLPEINLLPESVRSLHWLCPLIAGCVALLPVLCGALFVWVKGPERRWVRKARSAVEARASASVRAILMPRELDGLGRGVEALWQALGAERRGEYRAAITRYLQDHAVEAALQPEKAVTLLDAVTELARQDLQDLSAALEAYRRVERRLKAIQTLAAAMREPLLEMKAEELGDELPQLSKLALERRWEDLERQAVRLESELDTLQQRARPHSASVPPVVLAPGSDPYRLLGISVDTPTPLIRKLRLSLAQLYHPDISESTRNSAKMAEVNAAYDAVMKDREREGR